MPDDPNGTCQDHPCPPGQEYVQTYRYIPGTAESAPGGPPLQNQCWGQVPLPVQAAMQFHRLKPPVPAPATQPGSVTLSGFKTLFRVTVEQADFPHTLLGHRVVLRVTPTFYEWDFDDDGPTKYPTLITRYPGQEYDDDQPVNPYYVNPKEDKPYVTHKYTVSHTYVKPTVTVTFEGQYSVDGGGFQPIDGTVENTSPASPPILICEARSELVSPENHDLDPTTYGIDACRRTTEQNQ